MDTISGQDKILLFRILGEEGNAWKLAFQTEHTSSESRSFTAEQTKDGAISSVGAYEASYSVSSYLKKGDNYIQELKQAIREVKQIELWDINTIDADVETVLEGDYSVCNLTSIDFSNGSEGSVEASLELQVQGVPITGEVSVTPELINIIRRIEEERAFVQPTTEG